MACKACGAEGQTEVCLHCGHPFCGTHRDEAGGVPACFECLKAEAERKATRRKAPARSPQTPGPQAPVEVRVEAPPAPLPEPRGNLAPLTLGVLAAAPSGGYVYWVLGRFVSENEWPSLVQPAGGIAFGLFVLAGLFAVVKTR